MKKYIKPITTVYNVNTGATMLEISNVTNADKNKPTLTKERNDFEDDIEEIQDAWGANGFWNK